MNEFYKYRLFKALGFLLLVFVIGILGFMLISNYSFVDALYMTVITVTTVGFGEVQPFTQQDKIFTIFLILTSITVFGYTVSLFSEYLASGQFFQQIKLKKVEKKIEKLSGHTIVCGYGRNGKQAISKLKSYNQEFVVIEKDPLIVIEIEVAGILCVQGDGTSDEVLIKAGVTKSSYLITALPSDADNLFVVLSAKQLNKNCKIISRASNESSCGKLKIAGADNIIMPDKLGGAHMASLVVTPDVIEFVDKLTIEGDTTANLQEISVDDLPEKFINKTILDLDLRRKTGCTAIGYKNPAQEYLINPEASTVLEAGSNLIVLGRPEQILNLKELF